VLTAGEYHLAFDMPKQFGLSAEEATGTTVALTEGYSLPDRPRADPGKKRLDKLTVHTFVACSRRTADNQPPGGEGPVAVRCRAPTPYLTDFSP
jgi:hypothetical protein